MTYTFPAEGLPQGRAKLAALLRATHDVIQLEDATRTLGLSRNAAAKVLSRWVKQGWLRRVGSGTYVAASLDSLGSEHVLEDPWILVPALFSPAYVAGRSAAEHWDLTEQIFRDIVVMTGQVVRNKQQIRHGATFTLKHLGAKKIFGVKAIWRHRTKVDVSDVHRTIIVMLDDPAIGGGIRHVADCLKIYLRRPDHDVQKLIEYAARLGNGAVFKRLGFLAEHEHGGEFLVARCKSHLSQGTAKLDPALDCPRLVTKWRLWIPSSWVRGASDD